MKKIYSKRNLQFMLMFACTLCGLTMNAQMKVGGNPSAINANSILEMEATNKGMLLPRVALTNTTAFAPLTAHIAGMTVYNTATAGDVTPGYYYNDGTKWVRIFGTSAANNTTAGAENLITITNGTGATLTAMVVGVDTAQLKTFLNNKVQVTVSAPFTGNGTSASPLGLTTNNTTAQVNSLITITNGTGATLTAMTVGVDTAALKTFVTNSITNGTISGNNLTAGSLLKTTGTPIGASLKLAGYEVDTTAMKTFIANNVNKAPIKDSIGNAVTNLISTNAITGKNVTAGNLVTLTGTPTGASIKDFGVAVDTAALKTFISNSVGKNTSAGSLVTVTNGTGAALKDNTVAVDTTAMKTFIANNVNKAPIKDSIGNAVTNLISTNAITGKNVTAGSLVTLTGTPAGASVKDFGVAVDTTAMKSFISNNITNGSISGNNLTAGSLLQTTGTPTGATLKTAGYQVDTTALKTFVTNNITNGAISGNNTTAGSLITVTNGTGASLKAMTVAADTTAMKTFIANNLNKAPIKDSIGSTVTNLISTNAITGKNVTAGSLVILTGTPSGASVKDFGVAVDTTALKAFVAGSTTVSNTFTPATRSFTTTVNGVTSAPVTLVDGPDSTTANNGLTMTGKNIQLGGALIQPTTITTTAANTISLAGLQNGAVSDSIVVASGASGTIKKVTMQVARKVSVVTTAATSYAIPDSADVVIYNGTVDATFTLPAPSANYGRELKILNFAKSAVNAVVSLSSNIISEGGPTDVLDSRINSKSSSYTFPAGLGSQSMNTITLISNGTSWYKLGN